MANGVDGKLVPFAPGAVEEELRPGGENVTVQPRQTVAGAVLGLALRRGAATLSPALSEVMY